MSLLYPSEYGDIQACTNDMTTLQSRSDGATALLVVNHVLSDASAQDSFIPKTRNRLGLNEAGEGSGPRMTTQSPQPEFSPVAILRQQGVDIRLQDPVTSDGGEQGAVT